MEFAKLQQALKKFGERAVQLAQLELGTYKPRPSRKTKWNGMKPISSKVTMKKRRAVASGRLKDSIDYEIVKNEQVNFTMLDYGIYVEEGRQRGKGVPPAELQKWIKNKKLKPRNSKGSFVKVTPSRLKGMAFTINRSIKAFGIEPNPFMKPSIERSYKENKSDILSAMRGDIDDGITKDLD
jgi:hypothetical protein